MQDGTPGVTMSLAPETCADDRPPLGVLRDHDSDGGSSTVASAVPAEATAPPGELLRHEREERGLTIEDLWRTTKINRNTLRALEASDALHLPAPIYTRGFVKAYAREVGLNPESTADEYLRWLEPLHPQPLHAGEGDHAVAKEDVRHLLAATHGRRFTHLTLALAAIGLGVYLVSVYRSAGPTEYVDHTDADYANPAAQPDATPAAAQDTQPDAAAAALMDGPLRVEFVTEAECWLAARVDGERVFAKLLRPGERQTLDIADEIVLRVGEPGALSFSINGVTGRPLGPAGQPVTVRITRDNFREFLSS
jgi:hypothetical protein